MRYLGTTIAGCLSVAVCFADEAGNRKDNVSVCFELAKDVIHPSGSQGPAVLSGQSRNDTLQLKRIGSPKVSKDIPGVLAEKSSSSLLFDGQSQYRIAEAILPLLKDFSVEVYAKAAQANHPGLHAVVAHGNGAGGYIIAQQDDYWVCFVGSRGAARFGEVKAGEWENLKITYEDNTLSLFRNGKQVAGSDGSKQLPLFYMGKQRESRDSSSAVRKNFSIGGVDGHHRESFIGTVAGVTFSGIKTVQASYINTWMVSGPYAVGRVKSVADLQEWRYFGDRLFSRNYDDYQDPHLDNRYSKEGSHSG